MTITTTIVSAFISNMNNNRSTIEYINYGFNFLFTPIHKIIFIDESISEEIKESIPDNFKEYVHIISSKFEDCYLYDYKEQIIKFNIETDNISKDTLNYMCIINNKLDFIRKAIELNIFNSTQFIWVDFGIKHIDKHNTENNDFFCQSIVNLKNNIYNKVRIGSIWEPTQTLYDKYITEQKIYNQVIWVFAGGVFGGDIESLLKFDKLSKDMCLNIIKEKRNILWETSIWYMIYLENTDLFSLYNCDHNLSLINNY